MSAADLRYGRKGGRHVPGSAVVPDIDDVELVLTICPHGHRAWTAEKDYETPRFVDGRQVHRSTIDRPCFWCGHPVRRATPKDEGRPVIVVIHVPADPLRPLADCPCGVAA